MSWTDPDPTPVREAVFSYNTKGSNLTAVWFNTSGFGLTVNVKKSHQKLEIRVILNRKRPSKCILFSPILLLGATSGVPEAFVRSVMICRTIDSICSAKFITRKRKQTVSFHLFSNFEEYPAEIMNETMQTIGQTANIVQRYTLFLYIS
jgi:hypothetical protein